MRDIERARDFHGHMCPGLARGIRIARVVRRELGEFADEDIYCTAETDSCEVDALQALLGCTAGKGNLTIKDYGKKVYTFVREDGEGLRIAAKFGQGKPREKTREEMIEWLLEGDEEELFDIRHFKTEPPEEPRPLPSVRCDNCGEGVMETKVKTHKERVLCIPCFEEIPGREDSNNPHLR
jgi:formylmethanofuran dehydrogenase subunit E